MSQPHIEKIRSEQSATIAAAITALNAPSGKNPALSDDNRFAATVLLRGLSGLLAVNDDLVQHLHSAAKVVR